MARIFAPIFGAVAFLVILLRSLTEGWAAESALEKACLALAMFSLLGGWVGWTADSAVRQSIQTQLTDTLTPPTLSQSQPHQASSA